MPSAADSVFAARMMAKGRPEGLNSDPSYRIFRDPPEMIQMAFGGRPWFFELGNTRVHRVGIFKGLGWELDPVVAKQSSTEITGVRITARPWFEAHGKPQLYDMEFLARSLEYDEDGYFAAQHERVVTHRPGLTEDQLKPAYAEVIGEHAV